MQEKLLRRLLHVDSHSLASVTRNLVLQEAGFVVQDVHSTGECLQQFTSLPFDAVLVHRSIRYEGEADLVLRLKRLRPGIPVIVLDVSDTPCNEADAHFCTLNSPDHLIELVEELLRNGKARGRTAG